MIEGQIRSLKKSRKKEQEHRERYFAKREKLLMVRALIYGHERAKRPNASYLKELYNKADKLQTQLDAMEIPYSCVQPPL